MHRNHYASLLARFAKWSSLVLLVSTTVEASYIGLEPERLVGLLELDDIAGVAPGLE